MIRIAEESLRREVLRRGIVQNCCGKARNYKAKAKRRRGPMDEAERARKKEILRKIVDTFPPETRTQVTDWKIEWILDAIEIVEKRDPLIRRAPLPGPVFMERGGEHHDT